MCTYLNAVLTGPLPNADKSFIVADSYMRNIYHVDPASGDTGQLLPFGTARAPVALAYDATAKLLYWTDFVTHSINKYSLLTQTNTEIYRDPSYTGKDIRLHCHLSGWELK